MPLKHILASVLLAVVASLTHAEGTEIPLKEAQRLAAEGNVVAMKYLGMSYYDGSNGALKDKQEALRWLRGAAKTGDEEAQMMLVEAHIESDRVADALSWLEPLVKLGRPENEGAREVPELAGKVVLLGGKPR